MSEQTAKQPTHAYQHLLQNLPEDWDRKEIRELGKVVGGGTPSRDVPSFWRGAIPWVTPGEVSRTITKRLYDSNEHISASGLAGSGASLLPAGSLMVTTRATLGARAINSVPMTTNQGFKSIVFKHEADSDFYLHFFEKVQPELVRRASGTTFLEISSAEFAEIEVPSPRPDEKRLITEILDTLDTAIHETQAIIVKLKAVNQGLLHDLLTRGIDTNGELRPPHIEAPHLYKQSPLGWIPKEWDVVRVGEDADIEHGFAFPGQQFTDKEVGPTLLVPGNFHREGGLYFTTENTKYFSGKYPQQYVLSHGDVLVVMTDLSPMTLILGRTVVLTETFKVLHNQRIGKFRFKKDGLWDTTFFAEALSQDSVRLKVIAEATGTTVRHTSPDRIKSCYVARPKLQEQQLAAQRITTVDAKRKFEEAKLLKLKQTKSGLTDDLLSGRVRVTPLLAKAAQQQGNA
ncbi:EcoKI restriction-modification system protein HsdS [compost metagenome]